MSVSSANDGRHAEDGALAHVLAARLQAWQAPRPWWVAFSGGRDSLALLATLSGLGLMPRAVHVDHALHQESGRWARHCCELASALGVALSVERVEVDAQSQGLEAGARDARYAVFQRLLAGGGTVLTAHHAEDQAETQLLQLLRGGGIAAIAGMPFERRLGGGRLVRPWLDQPRHRIHERACATGLAWIDDPSNDDLGRDRNYLRHRVMPQLTARWPDAAQRLGRSASDARENVSLLRQLADDYLAGGDQGLPLALLRDRPDGERQWLVRYWLSRRGVDAPGRHQLARGLTDLLTAQPDAQPKLTWSQGHLRRLNDKLFLLPPSAGEPFVRVSGCEAEGLTLSDGSRLDFQRRAGGLSRGSLLQGWCIEPRQGGERLHYRGHGRAVKKLLQEAGIAPWDKAVYPVLVIDGEPAALPNVAVADGFRRRVGWWPVWTPAWRRQEGGSD